MKLIRFYRDGELSEIKVSGAEETINEVNNFFRAEQMAEEAVRDMIKTKNNGQVSHVDELRLDFERIFRKSEIKRRTRFGLYSFKDSADFKKEFSVETILHIKNEQRYLSACFSGYVVLQQRFFNRDKEPLLLASLKNGYFYLLNDSHLPSSNPFATFKPLMTWIRKKISFKTSTK